MAIRLPRYANAAVVVDPRRAFGQPIFEQGGSRVEDIIDRWRAGDTVSELVRDFGVPALPSKKSSEQPEPEFLVDRSLGRIEVPEALRAEGLVVHTLGSIYGEEKAQEVDDDEWLAFAGSRGYVVVMKDAVHRVEANRAVLVRHGVRAFLLTNRNLRGHEQAEIFVAQRHRIIQRKRKPGPFVDGV